MILNRRMATMGIVPALDIHEDSHPCFGMGLEGPPVKEFALQRGEEALKKGVIIATADLRLELVL